NQFPMTPNGKVDRQALPAPNPARPALDQVFTAPVTPAAKKMTAIWNQILKVERVGIDDNFFDLGGDSLLATQIVSQIQSEFQTAIPLRTIFEHPTIASLTSFVEDKINNGSVGPPRADLPAAPRHESQLSYSQQLMWMLQQFEPTASIYNIPLVIRLNGHLNKSALEQSLNEILRRHEVLRAVFADASGRPVQRFSQPDLKELRPLSLTHLTKREQQVELQRVIEEELEHPFELSQGPLLRTVLIQLSEAEHVLIVSMHHIVSDGWSVDILIRELTALYEAYVNQRPSPLKELPMQYADFASLQREWLQSETLDKHLEYWQEQLSGMLPVLDLPTDRPRSPVQTFRGAVHRLELNTSLVEALQDLGRTEGATLFMVLLAAFNAVLHRYTGQEDICVGSPIAGRHWAETENMIGPFLNTLVLRTDVSGDPTFRELLRRVREIALGAFEHQDLPFGLLLERLPIERSLSRTPLFQVMLNMLNYENQRVRLEVSGLSIDVTEILEHGSKFDLTLYVRQLDNTLSLNLVYNSDLFDEAHSIAFLNHFRALLESVVSYPEHSLSRLPLLDTTEREQISRGKIGPTNNFIEFKDEDIEQPIARRFEQQVNTYPRNVAVKTSSFKWTYEELNRIANRVARSVLLRNGPAAEQVALLFKHDAPMVAAILGALKAGKPYVPLDTGYPVKRLSYMLQDSQAKLILTNNKSLALANALAVEQVPVINIDEIGDLPVDDINLPVTPESLAYILYTSGTTGEPKGVVQNHRNVLHHIRCYTNGLHITPEDRLTLLSSYSFDAAIMDIFGALLNGAGLYPVDLRDGGVDQLYECIADDEITIYHSTPTVYRYFAGGLNDSDVFPQLRLVVLGGEEVVPADVGLFKKQFPSECILVNGFGPTESTVSLRYFINRDTEVTRSTVPMGYPVEHTEVLILDEAGEPVLPHAVGEIAIRGKHVALGYWQREELTRKAFLPGADHKITYRTGDLGRLLADGSIEFRGRKDSQTKVRGHRVETSEIEAVLREHPAIIEAAAVVDSGTNEGDARLVAYIVPDEEMPPLVSEIRAHLKNKLPDYMLPSLFIFVDAMALTSNGKLDRRSLPAPYQIRPESPTPYAAPRTPQEETLADIWAQLLHVDRIGIDDNFFELGGDSLMIFQLISRIHEVFSIRLPMRTLLEKSTIAEQAELL
ncbi:MAG TPA: amino acid adenylation domain-containing protein, partial [Pyrinomonadaceae bacterium]